MNGPVDGICGTWWLFVRAEQFEWMINGRPPETSIARTRAGEQLFTTLG
jgi:hypothetical protein